MLSALLQHPFNVPICQQSKTWGLPFWWPSLSATSASHIPSSSLLFPACSLAILSYPPTQGSPLLPSRLSLSPYLRVVHSQRCQLTVLRALIHGVKEKAIERE